MAEPLASRLGEAARTARTARGLTQADVAERVGIASDFYSRIERGLAMPSVPTLARIVEVLGTTADDLLGRKTAETFEAGEPTAAYGPPARHKERITPVVEDQHLKHLVRRLRRASPSTLRLVSLLVTEIERIERRAARRGRS